MATTIPSSLPNPPPHPPVLRRRSASKTAQNFHPLPSSQSQNDNNNKIDSNTNKPLPLNTNIHVLTLVSPESPDDILKLLNIPIYPNTIKIGRQNTPKINNKITDGFFDSRVLSRNHAELFIKDNQLFIKDLKSSNGTFINNIKLDPYIDYKLNLNDKIDLGTTLESQLAHKKITCIVKNLQFITLLNYNNLVNDLLNNDDLINKRLNLFNNTFDVLLFSDIINPSDLSESFSFDDLIDDEINDKKLINNNKPDKYSSISINDNGIIKNLILAVNNEYLQQQRLREMSTFLNNYNNAISSKENTNIFKLYEKILKSKNSSSSSNNNNNSNHNSNNNNIKIESLLASKSKIEDQLHVSQNEINTLRSHLSTAQSRELELKEKLSEYEINMNQLRNSLELLEKKVEEDKIIIESQKKDNVDVDVETETENVVDSDVNINSNTDTVPEDEDEDEKRDDVRVNSQQKDDIIINVARYGGIIALTVAVLYISNPIRDLYCRI